MLPLVRTAPFRVLDEIIVECRNNLETKTKRTARALLLPVIKWHFSFAELGEGFQWGNNLSMGQRRVTVGRYSYIGHGSEIVYETVIGDLCMIAAGAVVFGNDHRYDHPTLPTRLAFSDKPPLTRVEADVWVGRRALIKAGTTLHRGCIVAAGSVVIKDVPAYSIVAGIPATVIKFRYNVNEARMRDKLMFGQTFPLDFNHLSFPTDVARVSDQDGAAAGDQPLGCD